MKRLLSTLLALTMALGPGFLRQKQPHPQHWQQQNRDSF